MNKIFFVLIFLFPLVAQAYCSEPSFTRYEPSTPAKPDKPYCTMANSCTDWDVRNYRADMENYVSALKRYVNEAQDAANSYAEDALDYAKCQLRSD